MMILVSNRLPVSVRRTAGKTVLVRSAGGLVAGLGPIHDQTDSLWVGNLGGSVPTDLLREKRLVPVHLEREVQKRHYEGYSNQVLWPLFHYLVEHVRFQSPDFDAYRRANEAFADVVTAHAKPDETIWVHDYHLMLLPQLLRQRLPRAKIGFFLHIPFPSSEVFRILPRKEEILRGLLGADLIGLHTYDYGRHLVSSFRRVLGVEFDDTWVRSADGRCKVGVFPLGVDAGVLEERARDRGVERRLAKLRAAVQGRKVILGVDRMDYTKGLPLRLQAYRRLLEMSPRWRSDAVFMQLAVPSRESLESYRELKENVERAVGEINGAFGRGGLVPVDYMHRSVPPDELAALYRLADVMWVTPIRDGMNLVAKEYVAHRFDEQGVLVLSEFAGAASEMGEALMHNPWDFEGSARVLEQALTMPTHEVHEYMRALRRRVRSNDVHAWVRRFLRALAEHVEEVDKNEPQLRLGGNDGSELHRTMPEAYAAARHRLIALDYDGTLVPIQRRPEHALPDDEVLTLLDRLADLPNTEVVVISGRDRDVLQQWVGNCAINMVAEHGLSWRLRGACEWEELISAGDLHWRESVREILDDYCARTPGAFVEEKHLSLAWHYRQADLLFGAWQARELAQHLSEAFANSALEVLHGAKVVEVRPQGFDKGRALERLIHALGPFDFVLIAGDDRTDEDMFQRIATDFTIKVGPAATHARYRLESPAALRTLLSRVVEEGDVAGESGARIASQTGT